MQFNMHVTTVLISPTQTRIRQPVQMPILMETAYTTGKTTVPTPITPTSLIPMETALVTHATTAPPLPMQDKNQVPVLTLTAMAYLIQ